MKKSEFLTIGFFRLVRVDDCEFKVFPNILDFERYVHLHDSKGFESYKISGRYAVKIFKFFVIDTSLGFVLNYKDPCNYEECITLIHMYL